MVKKAPYLSAQASSRNLHSGLTENVCLEELYLHENGILRIENIAHLTCLTTLGACASLALTPRLFDPPFNTHISSLDPDP